MGSTDAAVIGGGAMGAAGFCGHGLMHAPGIGRTVAELVLDGGHRTIDLSRLGWSRVERGEPLPERGIL